MSGRQGSAIGGHYYCYCKDGAGKWYEFNDSSISSIDESEVEKAFGTRSSGERPNCCAAIPIINQDCSLQLMISYL